MAEYERSPHHKQGHLFDGQVVLLDLWRLVTTFLSDRAFARLEAETGDPSFATLRQFEEDEITRILISTAIAVRIVDDRDGGEANRWTGDCGTLQRDLNAPNGIEGLNLREACNKIIHARRVNYDVETDPDQVSFLNPVIYLYGEQGRSAWRATLDVIQFAREAARVF